MDFSVDSGPKFAGPSYQRVSIASYASAGIASGRMSVCLSVCPSVTLRYCIKTKQESSAKLTNQRVSYAFTSSQLRFHARHILPTSEVPV